MPLTKLEDLPPHFYKYRSLVGDQRAFTKQILSESTLYWASPLAFNDPFECAPVPEMPKSRAERESRLRRLIKKQVPEANEATRREMLNNALRVPAEIYEQGLQQELPKFLQDFAVCSLSATPKSVLMWSHYADCHRGLCLRFRPLTRDSQAPYVPEKTYFELAYPIIYSVERPIISVPVVDEMETLERTVLTKADFWRYEEEWRLIAHKDGVGLRPFPPECLDAVILGARMPKEDREEVQGWLAQRHHPVALLEAKFDNRLFRLNIG